ncbi:MAG: hypothetical protein ACF8XB_14735 [Planctomycetota bacterium JB042]
MTRRDPRDPLEDAIRAFRARPIPPPRDGLEDDLLRAFDLAHAAQGSAWRRGAGALAAAAVVLVALRLALVPSPGASDAAVGVERPRAHDAGGEGASDVALDVARLDLRLDAFLRRLDAMQAAAAAPEPSPPSPPASERLAAHAANDPALYRLAAARSFEEIDPRSAARRYRELLDLEPEGTAAAVARRRLAALVR